MSAMRSRIAAPALLVIAIASIAALASIAVFASSENSKWAGSRTSPVHRIPLKDELNQIIVPTESSPLPMSARYSCAPCHKYETIQDGWHFNAAAGGPAGRPGEPWVWLDERTGTQIPLSYRAWKGMWNPKDLGLSAWDFTLLFGRHLPGGGISEPAAKDVDPDSRWEVSGRVEINCFGCHNASRLQDHSEWAKQIERQNFRWAATAAAGLGEVPGMASRLKPTWDLFDGPNPDDSEWAVAPSVKYDRTLFDSKQRAALDVAYPPDDARCLACHSVAPAGTAKRDYEKDVHSSAGIKCAECHRNDVSHAMIRGYEGEANPAASAADFTCRGCHLGETAADGKAILAGRHGAPRPLHKGLPDIHFTRLSCTVCHSGPAPANEPTRVRTARANRLGIFGVADWSTELPAVIEPVFIREANGKLAPHRMMWPAYWAEVTGRDVRPIKPERIAAVAGEILFPENAAVRILDALTGAAETGTVPVLLIDGRVFQTNIDGGVSEVKMGAPIAGREKTAAPAFLKNGSIAPLFAEFDPADAEASAEPEARIQQVLQALAGAAGAPGRPALAYKKYLYTLADAALNKTENKGGSGGAAEFFWTNGEKRLPLIPEFNARTIIALAGSDKTLTEEQVELVLKALAASAKAEPNGTPSPSFAYIASGRLYDIGADGKIESRESDAAAPIAWPLAHDVRPARQSLGFNGCTDCHSGGSDFFFAEVRAAGPLRAERVAARSAVSFMGATKVYHKLFGLSFLGRPGFKIVLGIAALIIAALLAIVLLKILGRISGLLAKRR